MEEKENIVVKGYRGKWYVIDERSAASYGVLDSKRLYLLEHQTYGDETCCVIINERKELVLGEVWNGFADLEEAFDLVVSP